MKKLLIQSDIHANVTNEFARTIAALRPSPLSRSVVRHLELVLSPKATGTVMTRCPSQVTAPAWEHELKYRRPREWPRHRPLAPTRH